METAIASLRAGNPSLHLHIVADSPGAVEKRADVITYHVGVLGLHAVCQHICHSHTLQQLFLSGDQRLPLEVQQQCMGEVMNAIAHNTSLLGLSTTDLSAAGLDCVPFAAMLRKHKGLTSLSLHNPGVHNVHTNVGGPFSSALGHAVDLEILCIDGANFVDTAVLQLLESFRMIPRLTRLSLCGCNLGPSAASSILEEVARNPRIKTLELGRNNMRDEGLQCLRKYAEGQTLTTLSLELNGLGDLGAEHLANYLRHEESLMYLNLRNNEIRSSGAVALCEALAENPRSRLTHLNLDLNLISSRGMEALTSLVSSTTKAPCLKHVDCQGNADEDTSYQDVLCALRERAKRIAEPEITPRFLLGTSSHHVVSLQSLADVHKV